MEPGAIENALQAFVEKDIDTNDLFHLSVQFTFGKTRSNRRPKTITLDFPDLDYVEYVGHQKLFGIDPLNKLSGAAQQRIANHSSGK